MLPFRFKRPVRYLVLDAEEDYVKGLIFENQKDNPALLTNYRSDYDDLETGIRNTLNGLVDNCRIFKGEEVSDISDLPAFLSLPSSILKARKIGDRIRRTGGIISRSEEASLNTRIISRAKYQIGQEYLNDTGIMPSELKFIGFKPIVRKINGYNVDRLHGNDGQELEFETLLTYLTKKDFQEIERIIGRLGLNDFRIIHLAQVLSDYSYSLIDNVSNLPKKLKKSEYTPTILMSYYAKEIL